MQERDRVRAIARRIERADTAVMNAYAFHEPEKVDAERHAAVAVATTQPTTSAEQARMEAASFVHELMTGRVLED